MTPPLLVVLLGGKRLGEAEMANHQLEVVEPSGWVRHAADVFERSILAVLDQKDRCVLALSGGGTPAPVFAELTARSIDWARVTIVQVDERIASLESGDRNLSQLRQYFGDTGVEFILLPVEAGDLDVAMAEFATRLGQVSGAPPVIDIVHLGLGDDGHTASLIPGDQILDDLENVVAVTQMYRGTRRLSLTRTVLDRAGLVLWLVAGSAKAEPLSMMLRGDRSIPAGLLNPLQSMVIADTAAASGYSF